MATYINARQAPLVALIELSIDNVGAGNGVEFRVPQGAYVMDVKANVAKAFDSGSTTTLTVADGTTTFVNAQDAQSAGAVTAALVQKFYPAGGVISVTLTETGSAATEGEAYVAVQYVEVGRWSENQG